MCCRFSCEAYTIVFPARRHVRRSREFFGVRKKTAPLGEQEVDHVQVFPAGLELGALGGQEMHVGIPAEIPFRVLIGPSPEPQGEVALSWFDGDTLSNRLILESTCHVHVYFPPWQPALALTVDVCVGHLTQSHVAAHVHVPRLQVRIDVGMMSVRRVWYAPGGTEMNAARDWQAGLVIQYRSVDPVRPVSMTSNRTPGVSTASFASSAPQLADPMAFPSCFTVTVADGVPATPTWAGLERLLSPAPIPGGCRSMKDWSTCSGSGYA